MKGKEQAIGIFDSGIGGLTVANQIQRLMPNEQLVYFGDTEHLPYGDKSPEAVKHFSEQIALFLKEKQCKAIVIACNTASAIAYDWVKALVGAEILVCNVIDPVVSAVSQIAKGSSIGVIGTRATVRSHIYSRKIAKRNPDVLVKEMATPLFAPMIEEGFFDNRISQTVIDSYLSQEALANIDHLILACTHYPLIQDAISDYYQHQVHIFNSAELVAISLKQQLEERSLVKISENKEPHHFYISDYTEAFEKSARYFFKGDIHFSELKLWGE